ncbi:MAG: arginine--tRNA ligase [Candidatus Nezhaarchaeales archaeon]
MIVEDPFQVFGEACFNVVKETFNRLGLKLERLKFETPPDTRYGELALPCFELARTLNVEPVDLAVKLVNALANLSLPRIIEKVEAVGGYVNFYVNYVELAKLLFNALRSKGTSYGYTPAAKPLTVIVEHTSGNPVHPLTVGTGRNAVLGDAIARLLKVRGHKVLTHFYIDDVGLQVAMAAYGYSKVKELVKERRVKPDAIVGLLYSMVNALIEIKSLKRRIERVKGLAGDEWRELENRLSEWVGIVNELRGRDEELFDALTEKLDENPEEEVRMLNKLYEEGDVKAVKLIRELCNLTIEGFKQTLKELDISLDSWDWESEVTVWSGSVDEVIKRLEKTGFTSIENKALVFNANAAVEMLKLRERLKLREDYQVPKLTLVRSDGTTLYTTRDVCYALWKLKAADMVISVVGAEQSLAQLQLKIMLYALGHHELADRYIHYAYELVRLPGYKMSGRRGYYVTLDQILSEARRRVREEVDKRWPNLPEEVKEDVTRTISVGAVRYALISTSASKPIVFDWNQVVNFERNSGPFINYAYVRALGILRKAGLKDYYLEDVKTELLIDHQEKQLILYLSKLPRIITTASDELKPELVVEYANKLSELFNSYYERVDVIHVKDPELRNARLALISAFKVVLKAAMNSIGIKLSEIM